MVSDSVSTRSGTSGSDRSRRPGSDIIRNNRFEAFNEIVPCLVILVFLTA